MATDIIISFLSAVPPDVLGAFKTRPLTLAVPSAPVGHGRTFYANYLSKVADGKNNFIPGLFARAGGKGPIGRVAVFGFSNGCDSGVTQLLAGNDAQRIDFVGAFDGIHGSFLKPSHTLYPPAYKNWVAFGRLAAAQRPADNGPLCVVTHSSIEPDFPSTTETGAFLWDEVSKAAPSDYESAYWSELDRIVYPGGLSIPSVDTASTGGVMPRWVWSSFNDGWYVRRACNGFSVFGWGDPGQSLRKRIGAACRDRFNNTADHVFQARAVLPAILSTYLVPRWNEPSGELSGFGGGFGATGGTGGRTYDQGPAGPLKDPFPFGVALPVRPAACPYPTGPDRVIVGSATNPCATATELLPPPTPQPLASQVAADVARSIRREEFLGPAILATAVAGVAGYGVTRLLREQAERRSGGRNRGPRLT